MGNEPGGPAIIDESSCQKGNEQQAGRGGLAGARGERALWARILAVDERSHEYFAERSDWPGAAVFTNAGAPPFNLAVIGQALAGSAAALLERLVAHYHGLGLDCRLRVTPLSRPAGWEGRLAARGFRRLEEEDEEFLLLDGPVSGVMPPGVAVRGVTDEAGLAEFVRVQQAGWGTVDDDDGRSLRLARRALEAGLYRCYMAYLDGLAAGAATGRFERGLAGIYGVATMPECRRRGVGTALVAHIVDEGRRAGRGAAFLSAEPGGYAAGLYRRLGFVPVFRVANYVLPAPPPVGGSS